jgi:ribosome-associated protein
VPEPLRVAAGVVVPEAALRWRAVRSSGPGGQNVNKVASKVELRVNLALVEGLSPGARQRLERLSAGRRDSKGLLLVTSQRTRDQSRNLADARAKLRELIGRALIEPRHRRPTRPSGGSREARLRGKRKAAARKALRRAPAED